MSQYQCPSAQDVDKVQISRKKHVLTLWYLLYKACDSEDGTVDWVWAKGLMTEKISNMEQAQAEETRIQAEVARRLAAAGVNDGGI